MAASRPLLAQLAPEPISILEGLVVGVSEGDRITINCLGNEIPVRLYGLAAPQTVKIDKYTGWYKTGQPYAADAFRALSSKVLHQKVRVEIRDIVDLKKGDPKGLAIAVVYQEGRNINLEMLSEGWGWVYRKYLHSADFPQYSAAERQARLRRNGLWLQDSPTAPWHFEPRLRSPLRKQASQP
jgi:endonuclease YncB( thermonuclease family)